MDGLNGKFVSNSEFSVPRCPLELLQKEVACTNALCAQ